MLLWLYSGKLLLYVYVICFLSSTHITHTHCARLMTKLWTANTHNTTSKNKSHNKFAISQNTKLYGLNGLKGTRSICRLFVTPKRFDPFSIFTVYLFYVNVCVSVSVQMVVRTLLLLLLLLLARLTSANNPRVSMCLFSLFICFFVRFCKNSSRGDICLMNFQRGFPTYISIMMLVIRQSIFSFLIKCAESNVRYL